MPLYEFRCDPCGNRFADLIRAKIELKAVTCPHCGSAKITRLISRFATVRSEQAVLDRLADTPPDDSDPKALSRWAEKLQREIGDDLGDDLDTELEGIASGDAPHLPLATDS